MPSKDLLSVSAAATSLGGHRRRVLLAVAIGDGGLVLVPIGERRIVVVEHEVQPAVEQPKHVAHVTGVFQG